MTKLLALLLPAASLCALADRAHAQTTAVPTQAGAPAGSTCEPPCRPGFYCASGECRSLCNPPCAAGEQCTPERLCVPSASVERQLRRDQRLAAREEAERIESQLEQEKHNQRLAYRRIPRITLRSGLSVVGLQEAASSESTSLNLVGVAVQAGWRQHFNQVIGVHAGVGALLGTASTPGKSASQPRDEVAALDLRVDAALVFHPFWRVYLGPVASVGMRNFAEGAVMGAGGETYDLSRNGGLYASAGSEIGFLFLRREQLDLAFRLQFEIPTGQPHFFLVAGYHFLLGRP